MDTLRAAGLGGAAALAFLLLGGCVQPMRVREAAYPDYDYDTVFRSAVQGFCAQNLIVYEADKDRGVIKVYGRKGNVMGSPKGEIQIGGATGGTPTASARPIFLQAYFLDLLQAKLPRKATPAPMPQGSDLELEKQKLELERQKLEIERQKLELERQKLAPAVQSP